MTTPAEPKRPTPAELHSALRLLAGHIEATSKVLSGTVLMASDNAPELTKKHMRAAQAHLVSAQTLLTLVALTLADDDPEAWA